MFKYSDEASSDKMFSQIQTLRAVGVEIYGSDWEITEKLTQFLYVFRQKQDITGKQFN